jgi:hypothetical protein
LRRLRLYASRAAHAYQGCRALLRVLLPALWGHCEKVTNPGENNVSHKCPKSTNDLRPSERRFVSAMQQLGHGRFESLQLHLGELVLEPWPTSIRSVKFGNPAANRPLGGSSDFTLKSEVAEFFGHVRSTVSGEILILEVHGGLPFRMEIAEQTHVQPAHAQDSSVLPEPSA